MEDEKTFVTCYDKECDEYATTLMTLLSNNDAICNVKTIREIFNKDRGIVSNEYVLTIGNKSSKYNRNNFKDRYDKYGIHIGYYGKKAWISCEKFNWDENSLFEFHKELISLLKELGMNIDDIDDRAKEFVNNQSTQLNKNNLQVQVNIEMYKLLMTSLAVTNKMPLAKKFYEWFVYFFKRSEYRRQQYSYAIALFFHTYIKDFLKIEK